MWWTIVSIALFILYILWKIDLRRLHSKPPGYVSDILTKLPEGWHLVSYTWRDDVEWEAILEIGERRFMLFSDQGRICEAEIVNGKREVLMHKNYMGSTFSPKTDVERLLEASNIPRQ